MKRATKRLSYLRMAAEVQKIAQPLLHTGKYSMRVIYHHHILQYENELKKRRLKRLR